MTETYQDKLLHLTSQIVAAHVGHNNVSADNLPPLINAVYQSLARVGQTMPPAEKQKPEPAVSPRRSVFAEYIICLEDGKKLKMLKRHLKTSYGMTPEQYRERWGLPPDYPMVAPSYAKQRSKLAKQIGLGRTPRRANVKEKAA
ncbi:MAG: MucR family transcriptional regulator [Alphaproteobacteria bacterium]